MRERKLAPSSCGSVVLHEVYIFSGGKIYLLQPTKENCQPDMGREIYFFTSSPAHRKSVRQPKSISWFVVAPIPPFVAGAVNNVLREK